MTAHALTFNAGSSSVKFSLYSLGGEEPRLYLTGQVEQIGEVPIVRASRADGTPIEAPPSSLPSQDHAGAMRAIIALVAAEGRGTHIAVVGHRIVHGGPDFAAPVVLNEDVLDALEAFSPFAPLHQPYNIAGVRAAQAAFPGALQIACFDTAFHRGHPFVNDVFALPLEYYNKGIRRYGFHGLSYEYVVGELAARWPQLHAGKMVVAHLGNGASMCAIQGGRSAGSTMGLSALDGLPMGTRCGQIDPGVLLYLMQAEGMSADELAELLYRRSGLLGLSALSNDMRVLEASDTAAARDALDYYVFRIRRELGALTAVLGGLDGLVFTGGIGENSRFIRARVCADFDWLGVTFSQEANARNDTLLTTPQSQTAVLVIPTNEELVIARAAARLFGSSGGQPSD